MLNKIKAWFAPPLFGGDEKHTMRVQLLNANMIFINIYLLLVILSYFFGVRMAEGVVLFNAILFFSILIFRYWLFKGWVNAAGVGLLIAGFIMITMVIISMGTVSAPATDTYVLIVILAGVFFRQKGVLLSVSAVSMAVLGLILAEYAGMLPEAIELSIIPQWLTYSMVFLVSGNLINYAIQTMNKALDSLKTENEERKQAAILQETIYHIAEAAQAAESLQDLHPLIQSHISRVMYANNFFIALYDEVTDLLSFTFSVDEFDDEYFAPFHPTRGLTAYVLKRGSSLLYRSAEKDQLPSDLKIIGMDCAIWLGVPLIVHGKTIGVMAVQHYTDPRAYTEREQRMLEFVSSQVATAIDRKQTEEKLRESNDRFRQIADNIQETFWVVDNAEDKLTYISPAYRKLWGVSSDILNHKSADVFNTILPEDIPIMVDAREKQARGLQTEIKYRIRHTDGTVHWVWDRSFPIFDEYGVLVRKAGVATDITDVKTAEAELEKLNRELEKRVEERTEELRQSEETYRALFENSNDGIFLLSIDGFEMKANQRALDMVGYTSEEYQLLRLSTKNVFAEPDEQDDAIDKIQAVVSGEVVPLYERVFITKDGRKINVEINLSAIRDTAGKIIMVQSVVRDITARRKAENALRQSLDDLSVANLALEKASRLKDEFLASMSHELRTPLTGILGLSEALQMQTLGSLTPKQLKALKNIEISGRHLLDLINDILDLSKIEADKLDLQVEMCLVDDVCKSSLQLTRGMAQQKRQSVDFSSNMYGCVVRADPRRFKQMLVNLLSNAIKFTPVEGSLGLNVYGSEADHTISLTVWDTGIGIKPEDIGRLFKPFIQLDAGLSRQYSGTGLGLSLVDRLAKMHGGSVNVESTPGEGSRFTLTLPWTSGLLIAADRGALAHHTSVSERTGDVQANLSERGTILFADDNDVIMEVFSDFLRSNSYKVITASNGEELVRLAPICVPDLILADIQMPGMDGFQAIRQIRTMTDAWMMQVPIIAVTALVMPGDEEKCLLAGANKYLGKPVALKNLLEIVKSLITTPRT